MLTTFDPLSALATTDSEKLESLMQDLKCGNSAVQEMISNLAEQEGILTDVNEIIEDDPPIDQADELLKIWQCKEGQIWNIGNHRLMCGDSTKSEDVGRLMDGKKADMVFTDPPYGMNLDTDYSKMAGEKFFAKGKKHRPVLGDDKEYNPSHIFEEFSYCEEVFLWGGDYYRKHLLDGGSWFCWDKRETESADKGFGSGFELLWSKTKHKRLVLRYKWFGFFTAGEAREYLHPTQKPCAVLIKIIEAYSEVKNIIIDLFIGSGSTMVAAEQTDRICYGMELDPKYCAVILERMKGQGITGTLTDV